MDRQGCDVRFVQKQTHAPQQIEALINHLVSKRVARPRFSISFCLVAAPPGKIPGAAIWLIQLFARARLTLLPSRC